MPQDLPLIQTTVRQSFLLMLQMPSIPSIVNSPFTILDVSVLQLQQPSSILTGIRPNSSSMETQYCHKRVQTQGDPLAMVIYGLATIPLIRKLDGILTQVWYADDSMAAGKLSNIREWWDKLTSEGPYYGYFACYQAWS